MSVLSINNLFWQILTIETLFVSGHSFGDIQISDFLKIISTTTNIRKYKPGVYNCREDANEVICAEKIVKRSFRTR